MIIGIADRRPIIIVGLAAVLASSGDITVQISDRVYRLDTRNFDVLLMESGLTGQQPTLSELRKAAMQTKVLVVASDEMGNNSDDYLRAGAQGYISPYASPEEVIEAVRKLRSIGPTVQNDQQPGIEILSPRERDVLFYVAEGYTHHQIARRLWITKNTVDTHIKRARAKLNLGNKAELTRALLNETIPVNLKPPRADALPTGIELRDCLITLDAPLNRPEHPAATPRWSECLAVPGPGLGRRACLRPARCTQPLSSAGPTPIAYCQVPDSHRSAQS